MANRRLEMYEYRQVLVRMRQGDSDRGIRRAGLMGRDKAKEVRAIALEQGWLNRSLPLPEDAQLAEVFGSAQRPSTPSTVEPYREQVVSWHRQGLQATTIHRLLKRTHHFEGSYSAVRRFVNKLEPGPSQRTMRLEFVPGEAAQVDFGSGPKLPDPVTGEETRTWVFIMTLCWSRHQYAEIVWDQKVPTWLGCHQRAFRFFGGVPKRIILDNAKCAITKACTRDPEVQRAYAELAEAYDFQLDPCPPRDPKKKGRVESGVKYFRRGFLPGRDFRDFADSNRQLEEWVLGEAGQRIHGTTQERPLTRFAETERHELQPLPERAFEPAEWKRLLLHRDSHVRFDKCFYSAPFVWIDERLWVRATATMVQIFHRHELVASHPRCRRPGDSSTVTDHLPPESQAFLRMTPVWCCEQAEEIGPACRALIDELLADRVVERLRAAQGVIGLCKTYGRERLESACRRALAFDDPRYRTVKTILRKGLDQAALCEQTFDRLADVYTGGGRFTRDIGEMLVH
jgi:transposase